MKPALPSPRPLVPALLLLALLPACQAADAAGDDPAVPSATEAGAAAAVEASAPSPSRAFAKEGYEVYEVDGRLWIFEEGTAALDEFLATGEPAKHVIKVAAGPGGRTLKAPDDATILGYLAAREGFVTRVVDGRLWVLAADDAEGLADLEQDGEPAKHVIRPGAGPLGATLKATDAETADAYLFARPGFTVVPVEGRLWVFEQGSAALEEFRTAGEPAKHVIRPGAGPGGRTLKAVDNETVARYMAACEGFVTEVVDGRVWVFQPGSEALEQYRRDGEPAKSVTLVGAGPLGMTVRAVDRETADAYLRAVNS